MHPTSAYRARLRLSSALLGSAVLLAACGGGASSAPASAGESDASSDEPSASAEESMTPAGTAFSWVSADPTVSREQTGLDEAFINPGAVIEHEGVLHMFANLFSSWPGEVQFVHLTSSDGLAWELAAEEPIFSSEDVPFGTAGADVSTGFVADDGTWVLVFETVTSLEPWLIGRATAPGPDGPWTVDAEPLLEPGAEGEWDAGGLSWPSVVRTDDGWAMYYTAKAESQGDGVIGMATSPDGVTWTKAAEPVLVPESEWEAGSLDRPRVAVTPSGFVMVYAGRDLTDRGVAFSDDGVTWQRDGGLPAITQDGFPADGRAWDGALVHRDGTLHFYLEIGAGSVSGGGTQLYLATAEI